MMLELKDVTLKLTNGNGTTEILKKINLKLEMGNFYALTGPNGGGKTSLAKVIMGIYHPVAGNIFYKGQDITLLSITERARLGIGYAFQQPPRFKGLKVKDLLKIALRKENEPVIRSCLRNVGLCPEDYLNREVDNGLSGGEMKRIEVATLMAREADLVIYDEPEAGVDLWGFDQLLEVIKGNHNRSHATTIVITHQEKILWLADEIILIAEGEIKDQGKKEYMWPLIAGKDACQWSMSCRGDTDVECYR
jgi:Fe-S cluster assembly ATP-binding protein